MHRFGDIDNLKHRCCDIEITLDVLLFRNLAAFPTITIPLIGSYQPCNSDLVDWYRIDVLFKVYVILVIIQMLCNRYVGKC